MALTIPPRAELGEALPDFNLLGIDGKMYSRQDFALGTPMVVMFICNHCPYVQAIEERLITLGTDLKKDNVPVIAICSNDEISHPEDSFENMKKRADEKGYSFLYLHDPTQEIAKKFGAVCTPDFFVYDKNHRTAYRGRLDDSWKEASLVKERSLYQAVQSLRKDQQPAGKQIPSMGCSIKWL